MRRWLYIGLLLLPLLACEREWANDIDASDPEGEVEITFTVTGDDVLTKTLGEDPGLTTMHVAVFGSSHYLKQYVKATPVRITDRDSTGTSITMPQYTFSVKIGLPNSAVLSISLAMARRVFLSEKTMMFFPGLSDRKKPASGR